MLRHPWRYLATEKGEAMSREKKVLILCIVALVIIAGCAGATGNIGATDPIERGLSYIAAAIVTNGVLRALFNK